MRRAVLAFVALLILVGGTAVMPSASHRVTISPPAPASASGPSRAPGLNVWAVNDALAFRQASLEQHVRDVAEVQRVAAEQAAARAQRPRSTAPATYRAVAGPADLSSVAQCIKDHESGNYAESSHPGSGSGAYQFIPGTWRTWSIRAGYVLRDKDGRDVLDGNGDQQARYAYAYQAPPEVQDAVLMFTLTHGGAGNWSPRYGDDPCTVGMGG